MEVGALSTLVAHAPAGTTHKQTHNRHRGGMQVVVACGLLMPSAAAKKHTEDSLCEEGAEGVDVALAALGLPRVQLGLAAVGGGSLALARPVWASWSLQLAAAPYVDAACCC